MTIGNNNDTPIEAKPDYWFEATPDYWFIVLFRAMRESNLPLAAEAQERLAELGVDVKFNRLLPDGEGRADA